MNKWIASTLTASALIGTNVTAQAANTVPALIVGQHVSAEAEVQAINLRRRLLTLKLEDGWSTIIKVGPEVKNLDKVKVGDRLKSEYSDALTVKLKKNPGIRSTVVENQVDRAALGEKPAATATRKVHFVADIVKVDAAAGTLTVKGAKGNSFDVRPQNANVLSRVKEGDQVEGTFQQVISLGVIPAAAK